MSPRDRVISRARAARTAFVDVVSPVMRLVPMSTWLDLKHGTWVEHLTPERELRFLDAAEIATDALLLDLARGAIE